MYQLTDDVDAVMRLADGANIPRGHRFWDEYEAWRAAGNQPAPAPDRRVDRARTRRNDLLRASDWTQTEDSPLSIAEKLAWRTYRAELRALPQLPGFPNVDWPRPPVLADGAADQPDPSTRTSPTRT